MKPTRFAPLFSLLALLFLAGHAVRIAAQADTPYVLMISIDGLKPSTYTAQGPSKVPTLRKLAADGVFAEGVIGVTPTVTYPSHTTMITGVLPAVHGIYSNTVPDPEGIAGGSWYWYARDVKVPTLPRAVKKRGFTTAAVSWPVTVDADIDYLMPEFGGVTRHPKWLDLIRALSTPRGLMDDYERDAGSINWPMTDDDRTGLAAWIVRTYRPHLMLLHIFGTDDAQHAYGPESPEALAAIEKADGHVAQMLAAVADAGLERRTNVVVVSDHGFLPLKQRFQLNHVLKREGLIEVDEAGKIRRWDAYYHGNGGSGMVLLKDPEDAALRDRVGKLLRTLAADPANGIREVWDRDDLRKRGADPRASFGVDLRDGFYSGGGHDALITTVPSRGGHGFAPDRPDLHASLIMRGPDVPRAGNLGIVRMTQVGPTLARWFGVGLAAEADEPLQFKGGDDRWMGGPPRDPAGLEVAGPVPGDSHGRPEHPEEENARHGGVLGHQGP